LRFTVRRPASAEVSPCCHRPSGGDVTCGIDVGIAGARVAGDAPENRLALAIFQRNVPAPRASLRRVRCCDKFKAPLRLMFQPGNQQPPSLAADLAIKASFLGYADSRTYTRPARRSGHGAHIQLFHTNGIKTTCQICGRLLHPVAPPVGLARIESCDGELCSCSPVRAASGLGQAPLQTPQPPCFTGTKASNSQQLPIGERHRDRHAAIHTHNAAISRSGDRIWDDGKCYVPALRSIPSDSVGLHGVGDSARPPEPYPTNLGYPYLSIAAANPFDVARFDTDLPESFVLAGLTPCWATVAVIEEIAHRLREVAQRLLLHGLGSGGKPVILGASRRQLETLLVVVRRFSAWLPVLLLLDGQIPHEPGMATVLGQRCGLLTAGQQAKSGHTSNLATTTDNHAKGGKRRLLLGRKPRVSMPQIT